MMFQENSMVNTYSDVDSYVLTTRGTCYMLLYIIVSFMKCIMSPSTLSLLR